jgi:hypothetical protein
MIEGRNDGDLTSVSIGGLRSALAEIDSWKLRAELAEAALKPEQQERDKMEHAADDVLGFVKQMAELPRAVVLNPVQTLWDMSVKAQRLLKDREAAYDKEHKK